jgi:hypothetical protein
MFVAASLISDYLFQPIPSELGRLAQTIGQNFIACEHGYTVSGYAEISRLAIKDRAYFSKIATETALYSTRQEFLSRVGAVMSLSENEAVDGSAGLALPAKYSIIQTVNDSTANHIPQILSLTSGGAIITSICGNFDFKTKVFKGMITTGSLWDFNNGNF